MRPSLLFALSICMGFSPLAQAESPQDGGDLFVEAFMKADQGKDAEEAGHLDLALSKLKKAARMLDEVATKFPVWSPAIVKYRKERTAEAIARVRMKIANPGRHREDKSPDADRKELDLRLRELNERRQAGEASPWSPLKPGEPLPKNWKEVKFNGHTSYYIILLDAPQ
jgi:hypothetical protein